MRPGFEGGQLPLIKRLPRKRGFTNIHKAGYNIVNVDKLNIFEKQLHCFNMRIKIKDLENSEYFTEILGEFKEYERKNRYYEIGKAVILPIKEKIFYLWAESEKILKEMIYPILKIECI